MEEIKSRRIESIDVIRGIAVISVICAHMSGLTIESSSFSEKLNCLLNNLGTVGVPVFLVISGFFYSGNRDQYKLIMTIKRIVIPWLFWGTVVFFYSFLRDHSLNYVNWILGIGSYLYYIPVYILILLLNYFIAYKNKQIVYGISVISFLLNVLVELDVVQFNQYINPLFWYMWFGLGFFLQEHKKLISFVENNGIIFLVVFVIYQAIFVLNNYRCDAYFGIGYILYELVNIGATVSISKYIGQVSFLSRAGENSLFAYLIHMPIAGIVNRIFYNIGNPYFELIKVPIVFCVILFLIVLISKLKGNKLIKILTGMR